MNNPRLNWIDSEGEEQVFQLDRPEVIIGRKGDADIVLQDQHVSRHHATIIRTEQGHEIVDLQSTHGSYVNGARIERQPLRHGDLNRLGKERAELYYFTGAGNVEKQRKEKTHVLDKPLSDLSLAVTPGASELEKISIVLDFQYQWEQTFTPERAFAQILLSALKISGAEQAFILVRDSIGFGYAAGIDAQGRTLSQSEFHKTSRSVVEEDRKSVV